MNSGADRGRVFDAVEKTLSQPGPVRDDLMRRGLYRVPSTANITDGPVPGEIQVGEIERLVKQGVYAIDRHGYLVFGPAYSPMP